MKTKPVLKQGLIFDLDGTLVETLPDIARAINMAREALGLRWLPERDIVTHVGNGTQYLVRQTVPVPEARFEEAHALYLKFYDRHMLDHAVPYQGVMAALQHFRERKLAVVTNKPARQTEQILTGVGMRSFFSMVLAGDSLPEKKPHPLPLFHFMEQHGLEPGEVVMIGDGISDIRAGKAAGVMTVGVATGVETAAVLHGEGADCVMETMAELTELIA